MATPVDNTAAGAAAADNLPALESMANATHGNAKALFGILFIQYCSYAFFYIMDHILDLAPPYYIALKVQKKEDEKNK